MCRLQEMADALRSQGIAPTALLVQGETVKAVIQQAERLSADLIVVGSRKTGLLHDFLSGGPGQVGLKSSGRPVLLVPIH